MSYDVIIPTNFDRYFIIDAIKSIENQKFLPSLIVICAKNNTTDSSVELSVRKLKTKCPIKIVFYSDKTKSINANDQRKYALQFIKSPYVCFLDDDDLWLRNKSAHVMQLLKKDLDYLVSDYIVGTHVSKSRRVNTGFDNIGTMNSLGGFSGVCVKTKILRNDNIIDERLFSCQDWLLWIKLIKCRYKCLRVNEAIYFHRKHQNDRITNNPKKAYYGLRTFYFLNKDFLNRVVLLRLLKARYKYYRTIKLIDFKHFKPSRFHFHICFQNVRIFYSKIKKILALFI